ncbi:autophagy-related protein 16 [Trichonephila clavipes]|uniref:Autophagy-related protein 16 n=1 Tax=Trichonephila clavipes TaxID=2585209 RepID=A0A8X6RDJ1_TRICX|nr:autophagy-related protein 16 [Trichonephila clavipes]
MGAVQCSGNDITDAIVPKKVQYKFDAHDGEVNAVAWTHSDFKFATAGGDRKVKLWDFVSGQIIIKGVANESNSSLHSVDFDAEEQLLLAASCDFASRIWSINDMKIKHTLTGHSNKVMSAKFLGETGKVVSGSHDRTLKIWDLRRRASNLPPPKAAAPGRGPACPPLAPALLETSRANPYSERPILQEINQQCEFHVVMHYHS